MKLLLVAILAVVAVDSRSFIPKKFSEDTVFDKVKYFPVGDVDVDVNDVNNEIVPFVADNVDANKPYYYRYFFPGSYGYKKYTPSFKPTFNKEERTENFFYDPEEKYDYESFARYFTSNPVLATLLKYFPTASKAIEDGKVTEEQYYGNKYYSVPKEVVELTKTTKDLKDTLRTLVKYYYNLPNDVKATVVKKYDFENVVRFLLQVYYDIPNVPHGLTTYYDIPTAVVAELKTQYDLKKVISTVITKYLELSPFERDYYTERYFQAPAVISTLIKVYYGIPQFDKYDVENYYYDAEFVRKFSEEFVKKYDYDQVVDTVFDRRSRLTETEKEVYDRFFNVDEYVKFLVRAYYYGTFQSTKPFETSSYYTKKGFFSFLNKVYNYYSGYYNKDTVEDNTYPLEYYFNAIFGKKNFVPTTATTKGFPFDDNFFGGKFEGFKGFFDAFFGGYAPYGTNTRGFYGYPQYYPSPYNYYNYPQEFNGEYYGTEGKDVYGDYYNPGYGYGNYEGPYNKYPVGKKTFPFSFFPRNNFEGFTPRNYYSVKTFGFDKFNPFAASTAFNPEGDYYSYGKNIYDSNTVKPFSNEYFNPATYTPENFFEKSFGKYVTPNTFNPFDKYFGSKYNTYTPFNFGPKYATPAYAPEKFFEKYFNNKAFNTEEY